MEKPLIPGLALIGHRMMSISVASGVSLGQLFAGKNGKPS